MKGLALAQTYFETYLPRLLAAVPQAEGRIAAGLAGEGSQCFGFDDVISQDHDFGPGFCIWLSHEDFDDFGKDLQQAYDDLPDTFAGYTRKNISAADRFGVMKIKDFYMQFTGSPSGVPETNIDWLFTPEHQLAAAVNGRVFCDNTGQFSLIRRRLLSFYPEDVRRKKIAARAAVLSQSGQYNLLRCIKRKDAVAALQALSRFTEAAISMAYLLECRYMPFYKWAFHGLKESEHPLVPAVEALMEVPFLLYQKEFDAAYNKAFSLTESICGSIAKQLNHQQLSTSKSIFLQDHLTEIMAGIKDSQLRVLPPMLDCRD